MNDKLYINVQKYTQIKTSLSGLCHNNEIKCEFIEHHLYLISKKTLQLYRCRRNDSGTVTSWS